MNKKDILKMKRSDVRYLLGRIRTQEEGGASAPPSSKEIREYYEKKAGFTGWSGFARQWDVGEEGKHHKIVKRQFTEEQEWNSRLNKLAEELPWQQK